MGALTEVLSTGAAECEGLGKSTVLRTRSLVFWDESNGLGPRFQDGMTLVIHASTDPHSSLLSTSLDNTAIFKRFCLLVCLLCVWSAHRGPKKIPSSWSSKWLWATHCEFWEPVASSLNWWAPSLCYSPQTIIVLSLMMLIVNSPLNFDFREAQGILLEGSDVPQSILPHPQEIVLIEKEIIRCIFRSTGNQHQAWGCLQTEAHMACVYYESFLRVC